MIKFEVVSTEEGRDIREVTAKAILSTWSKHGVFRTLFKSGVYYLTEDDRVFSATTQEAPDYAAPLSYPTPKVDATEEHYNIANEYFKKCEEASVKRLFETKYMKQNVSLARFPAKGKRVRVTKNCYIKDKYVGLEGEVIWTGVNKWKESRYSSSNWRAETIQDLIKSTYLNHKGVNDKHNRCGIKTADGSVVWLDFYKAYTGDDIFDFWAEGIEVIEPEQYLLSDDVIMEVTKKNVAKHSRKFVNGKMVRGQMSNNFDSLYGFSRH